MRTALSSVSLLANTAPSPATFMIFDYLCDTILENRVQESRAHQIYLALLSNVVSMTKPLFSNDQLPPSAVEKLFAVIEMGINQSAQAQQIQLQQKDDKEKKNKSGNPTQLNQPNPTSTSAYVREAALMLLHYSLHFYKFPMGEGIGLWCSKVGEGDDGAISENASHWIVNKQFLVSIVEIPKPDGSTSARLILRNAAGKWAWDFNFTPRPEDAGLNPRPAIFDRLPIAAGQGPMTLTSSQVPLLPGTQKLTKHNKIAELYDTMEPFSGVPASDLCSLKLFFKHHSSSLPVYWIF